MYGSCLHCQASLGSNEQIEALPIGRRIAFDERQGRLWVVCRACERWNLTPYEERWEAIEQAERAFRGTRVRVSTDNIGLARLGDGTELVRVGQPLRPEFAAWRYGDQFGKRRRRYALMGGALTLGAGALVAGAVSLGVGLAAAAPAIHLLNVVAVLSTQAIKGRRYTLPDGGYFIPIGMPKLVQSPEPEGWGLEIGVTVLRHAGDERPVGFFDQQEGKSETGRVQLAARHAVPLLRHYLPKVNRSGASRSVIHDGVSLIEAAGGPSEFGKWAAGQRRVWGSRQTFGDTGDLQYIPEAARLAFEMAMHEDSERRALEGDLQLLDAAWRDAEQIAKIADDMFTPAVIESRLRQLRDGTPPSV
jgi:hypothetical protein